MTESSAYQGRYWKELFALRVHVSYLELYMEKMELIEKTINIFLAATSSSSICGWAIWNEYSFIWAIIIAISQLINAVKQFFPYKTRLKVTSSSMRDLEQLATFAEMKWLEVAEGDMTEKDINKLRFDIKSKKTKVMHKHLGMNTLPAKSKLLDKAKHSAEIYFNNFYGE